MNRIKTLASLIIAAGAICAGATISCQVNSSLAITGYTSAVADINGNFSNTAARVDNGTGVSPNTFSCPIISSTGTITQYMVLATGDYSGGPIGTTSGTAVDIAFVILSGQLNGASQVVHVTGGNSSSGTAPPTPFQIGSTIGGQSTYNGFMVGLVSGVVSGKVGASTAQVVINYSETPEPPTYAAMGAGLLALYLHRRHKLAS